MIRYFLYIVIFSSFIPCGFAKTTIRSQVLDLFPKEITSLTPEDTRQTLEKKFSSKISKKEDPNALYLNFFEEKNDVTLGTENGRLAYIYLEVPRSLKESNKQLYNFILDQLSENQKKKIITENQKKITHETGRFITLDLPEEGLKLEFANNERKSLNSVIIFPMEKR